MPDRRRLLFQIPEPGRVLYFPDLTT